MAGNEDMANGGNNPERAYSDAATAQLGERVYNLNRRQSDLETEMRSGFKQVENAMSAIANEMRSSISGLSSSLAERSRTQWPVIWTAAGVSFTILAALTAFVYGTLSKDQSRLDAATMKNLEITQTSIAKLAETTQQSIAMVTERMVTRQEMEYRQQRGSEDRTRMELSIKDIRDAQVPRAELERVWSSQANTDADKQRQIDALRQDVGSQYTTRDILLQTQAEVKDLRGQLRQLFEDRVKQPPQ